MELTISGVRKIYSGYDGEPPFSLTLPDLNVGLSNVVFILGHNGSGKSVTLKLLAGELLPSEGYVLFTRGGESWKAHERPAAIVRQRAEDSLAMDLTVRENLLIRANPKSFVDSLFPSTRLTKHVQSLIHYHIELQNKLDQPCRNLSGGQRQALAFLTVISQQHPILLLDEFLAATDSETSNLLRKLARSYAERTRACVFVVSHDIRMALTDADRILVLSKGHLLRDLLPTASDWNEGTLLELLRSTPLRSQ